MSTRYVFATTPTHDRAIAQKEYDHIKEVLFFNQDTPDLQLVRFTTMSCVVFITRELASNNPYTTFYKTHCPALSWITDEGDGGYLTQ